MRNVEPLKKPVRLRSEGDLIKQQRRLEQRDRQTQRSELRKVGASWN